MYTSKKGDLTAYNISQWVEEYPGSESRRKDDTTYISLLELSQVVLETLQKFIASSDEEVEADHIPTQVRNEMECKVHASLCLCTCTCTPKVYFSKPLRVL